MKLLVIGSGGREHAICWKIAQSKKVSKLYAAPGNSGISQIAECVDIRADDIPSLIDFVKKEKVDVTFAGPEAPLVAGIVDTFDGDGLRIFGPDRYCAQLEGSKVFAKEKMRKFGIPTADFKVFDNPDDAKGAIRQRPMPLVIKADGLCAGKGVVICQTEKEAISAINRIMVKREFGSSGDRIIVEDYLAGEEASIILVTDGRNFIRFASSQDHKRVFDNDKGPNTGGMGAYSPATFVTEGIWGHIEDKIIRPLLGGFYKEKRPYKGVLYIGLIIAKKIPYVLEFNVRFGDPETQAILPRLETDLVDIINASIDGRIRDVKARWNSSTCVCIVCASGGYPGDYKKGFPIYGLDKIAGMKDVIVFHAGTRLMHNAQQATSYETNGGRVLNVTALGKDIGVAIKRAYEACSFIKFEGIHYRKDIGCKAISKLKNKNLKVKT